MPTAPVTDLGTAITTSIAGMLLLVFAAIPKIVAFLAILVIGWFIASLVAKLVGALLRTVHFNDLATRAGVSSFVVNMGLRKDPSAVLADLAKWFIRVIALVAAFDALGLPAVSGILTSFLAFMPNLVVALLILVLAGLAASFVSKVVRGSTATAEVGDPELLAKVASAAIWVFAVVIAVNQLGIATTLVNTLFMGFVGALALAFGLAFGLGGRETAARVVSSWYERAPSPAPRLEPVAQGPSGNGRVREREEEPAAR